MAARRVYLCLAQHRQAVRLRPCICILILERIIYQRGYLTIETQLQ